jgi:phosphotransferase system HPr (HPr) family protein
MKRTRITVPWKAGLHLRPAAKVVKCAQSFRSSISLKVNERIADARSIFGILLLSATLGAAVELEVSGVDEELALTTMTSLFESGDGAHMDEDSLSLGDHGQAL